ncbi:MAG: hypothetical protein NTW06_02470, partial [Candidatus Falkowbacteria bacterium]|nr:hypothetical protein [Candidatus Falkowbacteria bacterium]
ARDFELYLKTGSGKAFAYKHFVSVALAKYFLNGRIGVPKRYRRTTVPELRYKKSFIQAVFKCFVN